jgi:glucose-1-phosphatase
VELHTPIGSKLVFEKWTDGSEEYVAINLVFQSVSELQGRTLLSWVEEDGLQTPMVLPVTIDGLTANADGLYRLADVDARFAEAMAEYDAIEDAATDVPSPARIVPISQGSSYTLGGMQANDSTRGIIVSDNQKVVKR